MAYGPKYCLSGLLLLALIYLNQSAPEKAMSCNQAMEYLIMSSCQDAKILLAKSNIISSTDIKSVCEYFKHVALSVNVNQDKAHEQLRNIDVSTPDQSNVNSDTDLLMNDARFRLNRYKNFEMMGQRPTIKGHSGGVGHGAPNKKREAVQPSPTAPPPA